VTPHDQVSRAWDRIMRGARGHADDRRTRYPLAWPPPWEIGAADLVALGIAMYAGDRPDPYLWWSTRRDLDQRLGLSRRWIGVAHVPLPPVAQWPEESRGWLVRQMLDTMTHEEVAAEVPYALWPSVERDALMWRLRFDEGLTAQEVANKLGITRRAVNYALARHRDRS